jgi:hypothetical protein
VQVQGVVYGDFNIKLIKNKRALTFKYRASLYSFQKDLSTDDPTALASNIKNYVGIDKRDGLIAIGEKLVGSE